MSSDLYLVNGRSIYAEYLFQFALKNIYIPGSHKKKTNDSQNQRINF